MRNRKFPSNKNLEEMEEFLSNSEGSYILPPNAGAVEKAKYEVCRYIIVFMHTEGLNKKELANKIDIPETRVSEIVHYKIGKFTLDNLVSYCEIVNPKISLRLV